MRRRTFGLSKDKAHKISLATMAAYIKKYNKDKE